MNAYKMSRMTCIGITEKAYKKHGMFIPATNTAVCHSNVKQTLNEVKHKIIQKQKKRIKIMNIFHCTTDKRQECRGIFTSFANDTVWKWRALLYSAARPFKVFHTQHCSTEAAKNDNIGGIINRILHTWDLHAFRIK